MYPLQCKAGYFMPIYRGKFQIVQFEATVKDPTDDARLTLVDDNGMTHVRHGRILPASQDTQEGFIDIKGVGGQNGNLSQTFNGSITTRDGISAMRTTNIQAGTLKVFVR